MRVLCSEKALWEDVGGYDEHMPSMGVGGLGFLAASCCPWLYVFPPS